MKTIWKFDNCEADKSRILKYWEKKEPRIERRLKNYSPELVDLYLTIEHHPTKNFWQFRAVLQLPTGTLVAEESKPTAEEVIDIVVDELIREISRHKGQVRKDYIYRRRRQAREEVSAIGPYLSRDAEQKRREAFFQLITPLLKSVYHHARLELDVLIQDGVIDRSETTVQDLVDDVITKAWEQYADRPESVPLDVWLMQLLHERFEELKTSAAKKDLADVVDPNAGKDEPLTPDGDVDEIDFWLERIFQQDDSLHYEDLLPDDDADEAWYELTEEKQQERLQQALASLSANEREALLLHVVEGFDLDEIALLQQCSTDEIKQEIEQARQKLADRLRSVVDAQSS